MPCIVLTSCHGGNHYAFHIDPARYGLTMPTQCAGTDSVWQDLQELAEEWLEERQDEGAAPFAPGEEYTIGWTPIEDPGRARMRFVNDPLTWCGGYYEMPDKEEFAKWELGEYPVKSKSE